LERSVKEIRRVVTDKSACDFYHAVELPDGSVPAAQWDLRATADEYLGGVNFFGKRVIEIGPASGFLSFHMEKRGAQVACIEPPQECFWDLVPRHGVDLEQRKRDFWRHIERIRNSFWFLHHNYRSQVRVYEVDAYRLPASLGTFDLGVLASVLLHCSSPVRLIESVANLVRGSLIISDVYIADLGDQPACLLVPSLDNNVIDTWWNFSPTFFTNYLAVLGFAASKVSRHKQLYCASNIWMEMFTIVATRTG
jgi:SAM-dependent methyltransferase